MEVGIRELKNHLSQYLTAVGHGDEVVVTERGRAVARITSIGVERTIDRLIAEGIVSPAVSNKRAAPSIRVQAKEPVSTLVAEQRR
jgi:prevent-host-death family protein